MTEIVGECRLPRVPIAEHMFGCPVCGKPIFCLTFDDDVLEYEFTHEDTAKYYDCPVNNVMTVKDIQNREKAFLFFMKEAMIRMRIEADEVSRFVAKLNGELV